MRAIELSTHMVTPSLSFREEFLFHCVCVCVRICARTCAYVCVWWIIFFARMVDPRWKCDVNWNKKNRLSRLKKQFPGYWGAEMRPPCVLTLRFQLEYAPGPSVATCAIIASMMPCKSLSMPSKATPASKALILTIFWTYHAWGWKQRAKSILSPTDNQLLWKWPRA